MALLGVMALSMGNSIEIPCPEFHPRLNYPCQCGLNDINATRINCDGSVFVEFPLLPYRFYIQEFSQRHAGIQTLGAQLFTASDLPLVRVDFSYNQIRRLTERLFDGVEDTIEVIQLGHNLLGDNLNPVFSSGEFQNLEFLRVLDLSYNQLTEIEEGLLEGCTNLKDLRLDGNFLKSVPTNVLVGPDSLQNLQLQDNQIEILTPSVFQTQPKLLSVNLTNNVISDVQSGTFANMTRLVRLILTRNRIQTLKAGSLGELTNLVELDLSFNFLDQIPVQGLKNLESLKFLNLASNQIRSIKEADMQFLSSLEYLDLSRNLIGEIMPGTFLGMDRLKGLDFSVNVVRKIEDDAFEGLDTLEYLDMSDNKILALPAAALARLTNLKRLKVDYNRIGAITGELLSSIPMLEELSLAYNIIHDIPIGTFASLDNLKILNLFGNKLSVLAPETFEGIEDTLEYLDAGFNVIEEVGEISFPFLKYLNLEQNRLVNIDGAFNLLGSLQVLEIQGNMIEDLSPATFMGMDNLISLDVSRNKIKMLQPNVFQNTYLNEVNLSRNALKELIKDTFSDLSILEVLDLSHNHLMGINNGAFDNIPRLKKLFLNDNKLSSYKGDFFQNMDNDTDLHTLDLSGNALTYLYPESFMYHPQLKIVSFSRNQFSFFPTQFIKGLIYLEELALDANIIKTVDDEDFANLPKLKTLDLSHNEIESVSETAFQNSSQLQYIDMSHNKINELKSDTFLGTIRLNLDLSHNNLSFMSKGIFERPKVMMLQSLDLSHNMFEKVPVDVLQSQYFFLDTLKISHNQISDIPSDANVLVNIKEIDLSFNPLTEESINNVLNEPKTVRELNMAGTGILTVPVLETPFLTHLNLSHNKISVLNEEILGKPSLELLDVSHNEIPNLSFGLTSAWPQQKDLKYLDVSANPITYIIKGDFNYLDSLTVLKMNNLVKCTKVERGAFSNIRALRQLEMNGLPKVLFMDIKGILQNFDTLETVKVELKEPLVGDHLSPAYTPRLKKLGISGSKVKNIAIGALTGLRSKEIEIEIRDTQINNIPTALFFPVPMSAKIDLDVKDSKLSSLGPQLLNTLDSKQRHIRLSGLSSNPVFCDCNARALHRWLQDKIGSGEVYGDLGEVRCAAPDPLAGKLLAELPTEELTCEGRTTTTTTELEFLTERVTTTPEPDIITGADDEPPSTTKAPVRNRPTREPLPKTASPYNMDALIIGIVGGVVAFIAIIIIIICIVRLRLTDSQYRGGPLAGPLALRAQGKCTCLKPVPPTIYGAPSTIGTNGYLSYPSTPVPPHHGTLALTWNGTGPGNSGTINSQKMLPPPAPSLHGSNFGTVGAHSYLSAGTIVSRGSQHGATLASFPGTYQPGYPTTPYYVTFPAEDSDGEHNGRESGRR